MKENLSQHENLEVKVPTIRLWHVKSSHKGLWRVLKHLFGISDEKVGVVGVPVLASGETEELSKEQIKEELSKNSELRRLFFKEWLRSLREK